MNADRLAADAAFEAGSDLWIVSSEQSPQNNWWKKIDFQTGFLLSQSLLFQKKEASHQLQSILTETQIAKINFLPATKSLLLGTENHFFNKWVLVVPEEIETAAAEINSVCDSLKIHSIRFFSPPKALLTKVSARLSASLNRISFVD